jgi:hypothetical protein
MHVLGQIGQKDSVDATPTPLSNCYKKLLRHARNTLEFVSGVC